MAGRKGDEASEGGKAAESPSAESTVESSLGTEASSGGTEEDVSSEQSREMEERCSVDTEEWDVVVESELASRSPPPSPPPPPLFFDAENDAHMELMGKVAVGIAEMGARFDDWDAVGREAEAQLRAAEEALVRMRRDVNIAQTAGSATSSAVGVPLMVAGLVAMPFTAGISAILTGVGTGISVAGGLTAGGACITETVLRRKRLEKLKRLNETLEDLAPSLEEARSCLFITLLETLREFVYLEPKSLEVAGGGPRLATIVSRSANLVLKTGVRALSFADDFMAAAAKGGLIGARSGAVFSNATKVVIGSVAVAFTAAVDAYTIVLSAKNMMRGNRDEAVDKLREAADSIARVRRETRRLLFQAERIRKGDSFAVLDLVEDALSCQICFELRQPTRCPACHNWVGCEPCLREWLRAKPTCPACRAGWPTGDDGAHLIAPVQGCDEILALLAQPIHQSLP